MRRFALLVRWNLLVVCLVISLGGCRQQRDRAPEVSGNPAVKTYSLRGKIVATNPASGEITLAHDRIPGYMEAMTMPYRLADPSTMSEMHAGDLVTAKLRVPSDPAERGGSGPALDHIVIVAQAKADHLPAVQYHIPKAGDAVPDFRLLNQSGRQIHLAQFRGRVLLLTFIYTRCPLADFCPRMSSNFAAIDKALAEDKALYPKTHLLSVSFDPAYDTPAVLRSYGGAHTGRFTDEDFRHWDFAAPSLHDLPAVEQFFNVGVTGPADPATLAHSLSTLLIGRDGRILAWYPSNDWKPAELVEAMRRAAQ